MASIVYILLLGVRNIRFGEISFMVDMMTDGGGYEVA
jgi:hypothetical protein